LEYVTYLKTGKQQDFSEQCNAWKFNLECECSGDPEDIGMDGGSPPCELKCIKDDISRFEKHYPYNKKNATACKNKQSDSPYNEFENIVIYTATPENFREAIDNGYVIVLSVAWPKEGWDKYGSYPYMEEVPVCTGETCGGHAVVIVAYDDNYYGKGKGGVIFKNSWNTSWGRAQGKKPAGYGVLPYPALKKYQFDLSAVSWKK
jgi:C1A family cysteine protease